MSRNLEEFKDIYSGFLERARALIVDGYWHDKKNYRFKFQEKAEDFKHTQNATEGVLEALEILIQKTDGERNKPGVSPFISEVASTIQIHLDRIAKYYSKNNPKIIKDKENKREEGIFQQIIFKGENKIKSKLKTLNLDDSYDGLTIDFHSKKQATIPFKQVLEDFSTDIKRKLETLKVDWQYEGRQDFYINKPKRDIPDWNDSKHFWDQEEKTLQFFIGEWNKIKKGVTIDGYFIHPWLYFHLNYFKTPIPVENPEAGEPEPIINPPFRRNEWYFCEILKIAEKQKRGSIFLYGSRRYGKSVIEASYLLWKSLISPNTQTSVTISNDEDRIALTDKISKALRALHPAFRPATNIEDWSKIVELGLKSNTGKKIDLCTIRITNLDSGSKAAAQKGAGGAPVAYVYDESGKSDFIDAYNAAKFSFKTPYGWKTIPIFTGTGSNTDVTDDAEKVLNNPEKYDFIPIDWNVLEFKVPPSAITWTRRIFPWFVPAQLSYEEGMLQKKMKFSDFVDVDSEELSKIMFMETDWVNNSEFLLKEQERLKRTDRAEYQAYCVFLPTDPEHCLMSAKNNPFNSANAKKLKDRHIAKGNEKHGTATPIRLKRQGDSVSYDLDLKAEVATYPHPGGNIDSPGLLFGEFPTHKPPMWQFISGYDDYRHETSDGDSVCGFYIFDRISRRIVYSLATRPEPHKASYREIHMALDAWNCKTLPENEDMGIKEYLDRLNVTDSYIEKKFDAFGDFTKFATNRKYGWHPDKFTAPFVRNLVIDYTKEITEHLNDKGEVVDMEVGIDRIEDIHLLEEMIKYKENGNFDRIVGFGSCLLYDYYLTSKRIFPRTNIREKTESETHRPKKTAEQRRAERRKKML